MKLFDEEIGVFPTTYEEIQQRIRQIDPVAYGRSRNFINGAVTYLSPYISRGVISTKQILNAVLERGYEPKDIEKFIQELAWRDYWQQVWIAKGDAINSDLRASQKPVSNTEISKAILESATGIEAIDKAITSLYKTGYMHNHVRMYVAAIACNMGQSHWQHPAKWMYYHLFDGDWASNALSWQWVAGTNSNKKYVANQDNINKYCFTEQEGTFLDIPYSDFKEMDVPSVLAETSTATLETHLPDNKSIEVDSELPTCIYNWYNLDPNWKKDQNANRMLLLEPSVFKKYPISKNSVDFMMALANNIATMQVYVGEFNDLVSDYNVKDIYFKEHPLNNNYKGIEEPRDWMFSVKGYHTSFFKFWNKAKKELP